MIFDFLKNVKHKKQKRDLIIIMIQSLQIPDSSKSLYLESLEILDIEWLNNLYEEISHFIKNYEIKELEDIRKQSFSVIAWMRKKELEEKQKELNSFSFLLNNL